MKSIQNNCFHTLNTIQLPDRDAALLPEIDTICRFYSDLWNHNRPGSDVWNINHSCGTYVNVSHETIQLLTLSEQYRTITDGAFNILAATVKHLIQRNKNTSSHEFTQLVEKLSREHILIDGNRVLCPPWGVIDFGSIAKGYVCDRINEFLTAKGVKSAMVNLGGNISALGCRGDGSDWKIGIRDPFSDRKTSLCALKVRNRSVVTSGMYERALSFHGRPVHHIIDPSTGLPCVSDFSSVTVVSESSVDSDAYSTAITVMGRKRAEVFIQKNDIDVFCMTSDRTIFYTDNLHPIFFES